MCFSPKHLGKFDRLSCVRTYALIRTATFDIFLTSRRIIAQNQLILISEILNLLNFIVALFLSEIKRCNRWHHELNITTSYSTISGT